MNGDEQTRLLQQILEVQKEQLAFAKQNSQDFKAMQQTAIAGQKKALRMVRYLLMFVAISLAILAALAFMGSFVEQVP